MSAPPSLPDPAVVLALARKHTPDMVRFLREMIAIPSESAGEQAVVERVCAEMEAVGFDEVLIDGLGNVLGRIGSGPRVLAMDAHLDTVGVGDASTWTRDPYEGALEGDVVYGRGAGDQEGGMAAMIGAARILREIGLPPDVSLWITGTVLEEDCDGLCWQYLLKEKVIAPEVVVITEPTDLGVYRGQRGRMEMEVRTQGLAAHGASPHLGVNAVYKMAPIVADVERLDERLAATADAILGKGTVTISDIRATSPSLCAVADSCTIHLDRRLTHGETMESAVAEIEALESVREAGATVTVLDYARPSWTGLSYPTRKYYPTWVLEEEHPVIRAAAAAAELALGKPPRIDKWGFSTNGVATCGLHGVPTFGFGPSHEKWAHTPDDQCPVADLTAAAAFYALFPHHYLEKVPSPGAGSAA